MRLNIFLPKPAQLVALAGPGFSDYEDSKFILPVFILALSLVITIGFVKYYISGNTPVGARYGCDGSVPKMEGKSIGIS